LRNLAALRKSGQSNAFCFLLAILSGALLAGASFPRLNLPWLAWLVPGLILWASRGMRPKAKFCAGYCAGLGYCLMSLYWLLLIPFPWFGVAGWLALSAMLSIYPGIWCVVCWYLFPKNRAVAKSKEAAPAPGGEWSALKTWQRMAWAAGCAAAWGAMEMAMGRIFGDYPFVTLGVPQFRLLPLIQIASVTGVYGVSFLVAWLSVSLAGMAFSLRAHETSFRTCLIQLCPPVAAIACAVLFGLITLSETQVGTAPLKIALVQPSFPEQVIWDPKEETNRFLKLMDLSRTALAAKPDLLVWPEAALPEIIGRNSYTQEAIGNLVRPARAWMVMGLVDIRPRPGGDPGKFDAFNSAFLIDPNGDLTGLYDKSHLLIFGEHMPWWARWFPFLTRLRRAAELTRGERSAPLEMKAPRAKFAVSICFEDCFPDEVRGHVDQDTDFILNLTNDGWFGESVVQWQHAVTGLFRAVENGVPLVRCCNNGLTCWVDAKGRLHDIYFPGSENIYQEGYKIVEVPLRRGDSGNHRTIYNRYGDWFGWGCIGIVCAACGVVWGQRRGQKCGD
jgi:apolipoprotein N-acyltransferase